MKKVHKNQRGFSAVEGIIILLVLGAIGLVGWRVYTTKFKNATTTTKIFTSYDECNNKGGEYVRTINAQFNACLGVGDDKNKEVFLQYSAQNLPRIEERKISTKENQVVANGSQTADLISFLKHDEAGCDGYSKIIKEVPNRFALLNYGCADDKNALAGKYFIIAIKLGDGWSLLSPTNNFDENGVPSCLLVDMFKISKDLSSKCFENTGYNNGALRDVTYQ